MVNSNKLTADQLKEMRGKWVRIVLLDESETECFAFVTCTGVSTFLGYNSDKYCVIADFTFDECGKEFEAYSLEEKHIDRKAWERCWTCRWVVSQPNWRSDYKFCPRCGKPLTEEAWEELEQRLME